jgi:hypothetical protein
MDRETESHLREIYASARTIAVVGATPNEEKAGCFIPSYLQSQGYRIIPVTPSHQEVYGEKAYPTLGDVVEPVDVVEVFRPAAEAPGIVETAIAIGAKVVWLQPGIVSTEAEQIGENAGITVIMDRCMGVTHRDLGLGPGP